MMRLPNFLIIGAAKAGTSALYHYLGQHPQIFMSPVKEPMFFAFEDRFPDAKGPSDFVNTAITSVDAYQRLFAEVRDERAIGEASPVYMSEAGSAQTIKRYLPQVKLIAILRHPAERAFSAYMHKRRDGHEPIGDFWQALSQEQTRYEANWGPLWGYRRLGFYYRQLKPYYDLFSAEQILILRQDQLSADTEQLLQSVYRFLEVSEEIVVDASQRINRSGEPKNFRLARFYHQLFARPNFVKSMAQRTIPASWRNAVIQRLRGANLKQEQMDAEIKRQLTAEYASDIRALQQLTQVDFTDWLAE